MASDPKNLRGLRHSMDFTLSERFLMARMALQYSSRGGNLSGSGTFISTPLISTLRLKRDSSGVSFISLGQKFHKSASQIRFPTSSTQLSCRSMSKIMIEVPDCFLASSRSGIPSAEAMDSASTPVTGSTTPSSCLTPHQCLPVNLCSIPEEGLLYDSPT